MILDCNWHIVSDAELHNKITGKNICIFGASKQNNSIYEVIGDTKINFVLDNDEKKWSDTANGVPIVKPQYFEDTIILSAVVDCRPLAPQLRLLGYKEWYFFISEAVYEQRYRKDVEFIESADSDFVWSHSDYKYLHIIPDQKFIYPVVTILERSFDIREHAFLIYGFNETNPLDIYHMWGLYRRLAHEYGNIALVGSLYLYDKGIDERLQKIEENLPNCDKIIFHGEWMNDWVFGFFIDKIPFIKEKGVLLTWSGIFGDDWQNEKYINQLLRFCRLVHLDLDDTKVKCILQKVNFAPTTIIFRIGLDYSIPAERPIKLKNDVPKVLITHSCFPYNCAIEGIELLANFRGAIEVYCLASYGDAEYIERVRKCGKELFGSQFHLMEDYMPYKEYVAFINSIDVAAFAMNRPGGATTIRLLAYTGAKLFLLKGSDVEKKYLYEGLHFYDMRDVPNLTLHGFLHNEYEKVNIETVQKRFKGETNAQIWRKMYAWNMKQS